MPMMKKRILAIVLTVLLTLFCAFTVSARAGGGGGGSSGGGGGGSSSHHSGSYYGHSSGRSSIAGLVIQGVFILVLTSGGSILLICKARKAKIKSRRAMEFFAQMGDNWDAKEIQRQVEESYFQIQECWRRMDVDYGAPYLSEELQKEFDSKIQWMSVRGEEVIQKNIRLLSAMPVAVQDGPGEDKDVIWYLIHGKMTGYYIDRQNKKVVRGSTRPEAFFEYWKFVYRNKRWVLHEIRQKEEMDIDVLSGL